MKERSVFEHQELAHIWAHGMQRAGRNKTGSMSFDGPLLYSYGSHFVIAARVAVGDFVYIVNDATCSTTTSRHQVYARRALPIGARIIHVPSFTAEDWRDPSRLVRNCSAACAEALELAATTRAGTAKRANLEADARTMADSARSLCEILPLPSGHKPNDATHRKAMRAELSNLPRIPTRPHDDVEAATAAAEWSAVARRVWAARAKTAAAECSVRAAGLLAHAEYPGRSHDYQHCEYALAIAEVETLLRDADTFAKRAGSRSPITKAQRASAAAACAATRATLAISDAEHAALEIARARALFEGPTRGDMTANRLRQLVRSISDVTAHLPTDELKRAAETLTRAIEDAVSDAMIGDALRTRDGCMAFAVASVASAISHAAAGRYQDACREQRDATARITNAREIEAGCGFDPADAPALSDESPWIAAIAAHDAERIAAWRAGHGGIGDAPQTAYPILRIVGDEIQTSHCARVQLAVAPSVWHAICTARRLGHDMGPVALDLANGGDRRIGVFELRIVRADGSCIIGCHDIPGAEFDLIAAQLGYTPCGNANNEDCGHV